MKRLPVNKTWKMYLVGGFVRSESGGVYPVYGCSRRTAADPTSRLIGHACEGSRKDIRNAVEAAEKAFGGWAGRSAFNRGQILYRIGEMMESRADELALCVRRSTGVSAGAAKKEVETSIDRMIYYAGWADKYSQILGGTNPVASPYHNFTLPEPMGVIGLVAADFAPLLGLIDQLAPVIVSGNTAVALASEKSPEAAMLLGEILAVSDVPAGVINLLTGHRTALLETFGTHEQIRGLDFYLTEKEASLLEESAAASVKRCKWRREDDPKHLYSSDSEDVYAIRTFVEFKTTWHPYWV